MNNQILTHLAAAQIKTFTRTQSIADSI